jgi:hypothetical protein
MESREEASPVPDDEPTYKERYYSSMVQVKGDIAGLQFTHLAIEARQLKLEKIMRVILMALLVLLAVVIVRLNYEQ